MYMKKIIFTSDNMYYRNSVIMPMVSVTCLVFSGINQKRKEK